MRDNGDCQNSGNKVKRCFSVSGVIVPAQYDNDFRVLSIKILSTDEKEYLIENNVIGKILFQYQKRFVKVTCSAFKFQNGKESIFVKDFEVVDSF